MSEKIDRRYRDYPEVKDSLLRELELLRIVNDAEKLRGAKDHRYEDEERQQPVDEQWGDSSQAIDEFSYEPQERQEPQITKPSDWGASPVVDTPVKPEYYSAPVKKEKIKLPSRRAVANLLVLAGCTGIGTGWVYVNEIENPYSAVASLPIIGKDDPEKKELLDKLLANCADEKVGDVLYRGNVSAESSLIWNVPNDGTISPLLPTRLDPGSDVERHPKAVIENSILTVGVCDDDSQPAINIKGDKVFVDLSRVKSRIMIEREKVYAEGIQKERLDASVAAGAFSQEIADALFTEMTSSTNIDAAVDDTLHDVGTIITARDSTYDKQIEEVSVAQIKTKIIGELAIKSPGIAYTVETTNAFHDTALIGLQEITTDKFAVTDTKVNKATITVDPNAVRS